MRRKWLRRMAGMVGAVALIALLYLFAGLVGGAIPAGGQAAPATGIRIYVEDNGIHTGIVLPKHAAGMGFDDLVRGGDLADPRYAGHGWLSIGWGDRAFYLGTPRWADVRPATIAAAAIGSDAVVLHVGHLPEPVGEPGVYPVMLTPDQYRRLVTAIRASFAARTDPVHGYGPSDAFYVARGRYSAVETCNAWTGRMLRAAGVPMGRWTPFPVTVTSWL